MNSSQERADGTVPELQAPRKEKTDYIIHKVVQALTILEQFHGDVDELSPTELSRRLALNEASVNLLLATLKSRNYLEQNHATSNYRLGIKNLELAQTVLRQTDLYRVSHPVLASLAAECGETTAVAVLRKSHVIELDAVHSERPVQVMPRVGVHLPVHCTAAGKLLIAFENEEAVAALLRTSPFDRYTPTTIVTTDELRLQLGCISQSGYAIEDQELDQEVRGVAAAIRDYNGRVVGAVTITAPSCRVDLERITNELVPLVQRGAQEISSKLGYQLGDGAGVPTVPEPRVRRKSPAGAPSLRGRPRGA